MSAGVFRVKGIWILFRGKLELLLFAAICFSFLSMLWIVPTLNVARIGFRVDSSQTSLIKDFIFSAPVLREIVSRGELVRSFNVEESEDAVGRLKKIVFFEFVDSGRLDVWIKSSDKALANKIRQEIVEQVDLEWKRRYPNIVGSVSDATLASESFQDPIGLRLYGGAILSLLAFLSMTGFAVFGKKE